MKVFVRHKEHRSCSILTKMRLGLYKQKESNIVFCAVNSTASNIVGLSSRASHLRSRAVAPGSNDLARPLNEFEERRELFDTFESERRQNAESPMQRGNHSGTRNVRTSLNQHDLERSLPFPVLYGDRLITTDNTCFPVKDMPMPRVQEPPVSPRSTASSNADTSVASISDDTAEGL